MKNISRYKLLIAALVIITVLFFQFGCDGTPSDSSISAGSEYRIEGVVVIKSRLNSTLDSTYVIVKAQRNDSMLVDGELEFDHRGLLLSHCTFCPDTLYSLKASSDTLFPAGSYQLIAEDTVELADTIVSITAATFAATVTSPANRINSGANQVSLDWTASTGAEGYVLATIKRNTSDTTAGFSQYATSLTTQGTLPASAFRHPVTNEPDTGWYYVYVYAYTEAPDSALADFVLPVSLPGQAPDNINIPNHMTGRFGSVAMTPRDSVWVIVQ